ncbi:DUF4270 family protein [Dyadobacter tibetensis]|uniref:DUF4270 family protein n=1 Tax=Dyadobacter tibetensis TaxID=1211851 RepID=UPI00046FA64F|nr:DUF4270 family protein [Dyadobacter tibetensis]
MSINLKTPKSYISRFLNISLALGLATSLSSCDWGDEIVSLVQPNPDDFAVLYSDTNTVKFSTVVYDSLMTGGVDRLLTGRYQDPLLGTVTAQGYTQPQLQGSIVLPEKAVYDSLDVLLEYDGYYYGDTTKTMNLSVHAVTKDIFLRSSYFNTSTLPFDAKPLGTLKFKPMPNTDSLKIRLSDELGKKIFDLAESNLMKTADDWYQVIQGITLRVSDQDQGAVIGIKLQGTNSGIRLHYHVVGNDGISKNKSVVALNASYNQISTDRKGTQLAQATGPKTSAIPSSQTNNRSFIQEGMGVFTRIDLPYLSNLKYVDYSVANRALLKIYPVQQSVTPMYNAPKRLYLYYINKNNEFFSSGEGNFVPQALTTLDGREAISGQYVENIIDNEQYYVFDVSAFVASIMFSDYKTENGLALYTSAMANGSWPEARSDYAKGVSRLVIGDQNVKVGPNNSKLELYYTTVKYNKK